MTDRTRTHLEFLVDMSGSMSAFKFESQEGFNSFISRQKKIVEPCTVSLNGFSSGFQNLYRDKNLADVPPLQLRSQGDTALYDSIARTVNDLGVNLAGKPEDDRPGVVIVIIVTDGVDTASVDTTSEQIKQLVERQRYVYDWVFLYLGSSQDAVIEGGKLGIPEERCLTFAKVRARRAYQAASDLVTQLRRGRLELDQDGFKKLTTRTDIGFTESQRKEANE